MAFGALVASRLARSGRTLASAVAQVRAASDPLHLPVVSRPRPSFYPSEILAISGVVRSSYGVWVDPMC